MADKTPRTYQYFQDLIESKKTMEPLAIGCGIGPTKGFNVVDTTKTFFSVTGSNKTGLPKAQIKSGTSNTGKSSNHTRISTTSNVYENIVNAHITPDGLLHVDPSTLDFLGIVTDYNEVTLKSGARYIVLKAKHEYIGVNQPSPPIPSISDFEAKEVNLLRSDGQQMSVTEILNKTLPELASDLENLGFSVNPDTEVLIGAYIIGLPNSVTEASSEGQMLKERGFICSLIPYQYNWPPEQTYSFLDEHKNKTKELLQDSNINNLTSVVQGITSRIDKYVREYDVVISNSDELELLATILEKANMTELASIYGKTSIKNILIRKGSYDLTMRLAFYPDMRIDCEEGVIIRANYTHFIDSSYILHGYRKGPNSLGLSSVSFARGATISGLNLVLYGTISYTNSFYNVTHAMYGFGIIDQCTVHLGNEHRVAYSGSVDYSNYNLGPEDVLEMGVQNGTNPQIIGIGYSRKVTNSQIFCSLRYNTGIVGSMNQVHVSGLVGVAQVSNTDVVITTYMSVNPSNITTRFIGFSNCKMMANCNVNVVGNHYVGIIGNLQIRGFQGSSKLTNCVFEILSNSSLSAWQGKVEFTGFLTVTNLTNCQCLNGGSKVSSLSSASSYNCYEACIFVSNCVATGPGDVDNMSFRGFYVCNTVHSCEAIAWGTNSVMRSRAYVGSYATRTDTPAYACADNHTGGFNSIT